QRRIRRRRTIAGCGVTALSGLPFGRRLVGLIRRVSVASGVGAQIAGCGVNALSGLPFGRRLVGLIRRVSVASDVGAQLPDAA
ncbi:hypothetical protein ACIJET_003820, partial [Escherichia albertii]